jgi:hypothetical protein
MSHMDLHLCGTWVVILATQVFQFQCFSYLFSGLIALVLHLSKAIFSPDHHSLAIRYFHCIDLPRLYPIQ